MSAERDACTLPFFNALSKQQLTSQSGTRFKPLIGPLTMGCNVYTPSSCTVPQCLENS